MKAPSPSTKLSRLADSGGSPSIGLRLGLGSVSGCWPRPGFRHAKSSFTFLQLQEMEHQALIFKYMVAGLPVPFNLVLPIWKSVANSFDGVHGGLSLNYPSFLACGPLSFDYRHRMEPEPRRCRRTDGKKWRCSKDVVPDQKYCEQHMHRGRQRSRKLVEASQTSTLAASSSINTTPTTVSTSKSIVNSDTNLSISVPVSSQLLTKNNNSIDNNKSHKHSNNSSSSAPPGFDLFRKRVLQVLGSSSPWYGYKNSMETEPGRCRRTDGRKWRCCKNVVPDQKYCSRHMHRGSRKHVEASGTTASTTSTVTPIATIVTTTTTTRTPSSANAVADTESKPGNGDSEHVNSSSKLLISITDTPHQSMTITNNDDHDSSNASTRAGFSPKSVLSNTSKS